MKMILTAMLAGLLSVAAVSAFADHPQVTISLISDTEQNCPQPDMCVIPSVAALDQGGEIIWSNEGAEALEVVGLDGADFISSGTLQPGQTYALTFPDAGNYAFHVPSHPWMSGTIMVVGDHGDDAHSDDHTDTHGAHSDTHAAVESDLALGLDVESTIDSRGGVLFNIMTQGWTWAPEHVNQENVQGEGHAHLYIDGVKINRVYGPYYYVEGLEPGSHYVSAVLNLNMHDELTINGYPLEATSMIVVPESDIQDTIAPRPFAGTPSMIVSAVMHDDALGGYNLQLSTTNFVLSGEHANTGHVRGEGYAVLSIDGEYKTRLYEHWHKMSALEPGIHTVTVSLYTNNHAPYYWNGQPIETSITVHVPEPAV